MTDAFSSSDIPDAPPPEVLDAVDAAWHRAAAYAADGLELHLGPGRIGGRVRGTLYLEDRVLLRLAPSQLLALACGDPIPYRAGA